MTALCKLNASGNGVRPCHAPSNPKAHNQRQSVGEMSR